MKKLTFLLISCATLMLWIWSCDLAPITISWLPATVTNCDDSCYIWAPGKAFTSPVLGTIMERRTGETPNWVNLDTFFKNNELVADPYLLLADYLGVPDSLVCSLVTYDGVHLVIQSGKINYTLPYATASHVMRVDTINHPYFQLGFQRKCNEQ